jgi:hypothetical protein
MMVRRAAGEAVKRGLRVWIAASVVVLIGLVVFSSRERLPEWAWHWRVEQMIERLVE